MAWQARHLLNELLPAARSGSSASAPDAASVREVRAISALVVSLFMGCSSSLRWCGWCRLWHVRLRQDKSSNLDRFRDGRLARERTDRNHEAIRPWWPTQACSDVLDLASQIDNARALESNGWNPAPLKFNALKPNPWRD